VFLDGLKDRSWMISNDRAVNQGLSNASYPKFRQHFELDVIDRYKIYHQHLLCSGKPR